ncbi:MAG: 4-hydroxybenzoate solanesyltransferase [Pseudanabaenaceae cyanobacterium]
MSTNLFWQVIYLLRWHKPAGRLILMIPALWALVLAEKSLSQAIPLDLLLVIIGGSLATSAMGCVINDLWDRDLDSQVERTKNRPLAAKTLPLAVGVIVLAIASLCAFGFAKYLNGLSFGLCWLAVPVIAIYPACKRFFPIPQLVLSLAWGFAVLIPWSAVTGTLDMNAGLLWLAVVLWTLGFDTVYAMSDRADDQKLGINSSALFFGDRTPLFVTCCFLGTAGCLGLLGWHMGLDGWYYSALAIALLWWLWQAKELADPHAPPSLFARLFGQNVAIGLILLAGMESLSFLEVLHPALSG